MTNHYGPGSLNALRSFFFVQTSGFRYFVNYLASSKPKYYYLPPSRP